MYIGKYYHRLEAKGRVSLPVKFREKLTTGGVITRGLDRCLAIFDAKVWAAKLSGAESLSDTKKANRDYIRFLTNDAQELEIDGQGRILISDDLRQSVGLEKEIVFVGSLDHIEIWDQAHYHAYIETVGKNIESEVENIEI